MPRNAIVVVTLAAVAMFVPSVPAGALGASAVAVGPVVVDDTVLATCGLLDRPAQETTCALWHSDADPTASDFWFANLALWDVEASEPCHNAGSSDRTDWILAGYPDRLDVASERSTFLCVDSGHSTADRASLADRIGTVGTFPVNECTAQIDPAGEVDPCPARPAKFAVAGFGRYRFLEVYRGDDPAAIGTPGDGGGGSGSPGACGLREADPNALCLVLGAVTPRFLVDAQVADGDAGVPIGDDVYSDDGAGQRLSVRLEPGTTRRLRLEIENDGRVADRFRVHGVASGPRLKIRYVAGGIDVTDRVVEGTYRTAAVEAGTSTVLRVVLRMRRDAPSPRRTLVFTSWSAERPRAVDAVAANVLAV